MRINLRNFGSGTVDWPKARLGAGDCTQTFLARELGEREDWRNAKGKPRLASARAALPKRSAALGLTLLEARPMGGVQRGVAGSVAGLSRQAAVVPSRQSRRGRRGSNRPSGEGPGTVDDGDAPSRGRRGLARRTHPLLDPLVHARRTRRPDRRRRVLAPQGAQPPHRLVVGGAGHRHRAHRQRRQVSSAFRCPLPLACDPGAAAVPQPRCGRVGGTVRCPPGTGVKRRGSGAVKS